MDEPIRNRLTNEGRFALEQSVRDLEHRLQESRGWANKPKPTVKASPPTDPASPAQYMAKVQIMYDLARLAFETDSTRAVTLMLNSVGTPVVQIDGATITDSYHNLSHHGMAEEKLKQLRVIDEWHMRLLADLFKGLKSATEGHVALTSNSLGGHSIRPGRPRLGRTWFRRHQMVSVMNGITGCISRRAPSSTDASTLAVCAARAGSFIAGLIASRYQSQKSRQKKS